MFEKAQQLVQQPGLPEADVRELLTSVGFADWRTAQQRIEQLAQDAESRDSLAECLPMLLMTLTDAATADGSLVNFERFVHSVGDRAELFRFLAENPRAVEILIKLFVGSQFLTEILLRNPQYLRQLTQHKRLAEFKSRPEFVDEAVEIAASEQGAARLDAVRRFQHWELLRIGACDSFGLMDLKTVTVQLSLLADSIVQTCLAFAAEEASVDLDDFAVLAFGKLGGEELNYSSDIDLVFVCRENPTRFWSMGQRLIKALQEATPEGFLYRVDMRLRPWGRSGPLVSSVDAYVEYLRNQGMQWEKQALLKARVIAGDARTGRSLLERAEPLIFAAPPDVVRDSVREAKQRIETHLGRRQKWGEVKSGRGSIRDVEFVTQYLQLVHGGRHPEVRSINTLDGLVRLADFGFLRADEFRQLTSGYLFLRTIEHSLQLMHNKQVHALPEDRRELNYLARRLDFADADQFLTHYERHCRAIRVIYDRFILNYAEATSPDTHASSVDGLPILTLNEPIYSQTFSAAEIDRHSALLRKLDDDNPVEVDAEALSNGMWRATVAGFDHPGDLAMICGLLFVYGFDIVDGFVFTDSQMTPALRPQRRRPQTGDRREKVRKFVNVFTVRPPLDLVLPEVWLRYKSDLMELLQLAQEGRHREARGRLAKRVAGALRDVPETGPGLLPIEVELDNSEAPSHTVLYIRAEDTLGFLYELSNALALSGINIDRVEVRSEGNHVFDTLAVVDAASGEAITDPARLQQLQAAVVLIKHFTHLLPRSPNPEAALLHFREFIEQFFSQPEWTEDLSSLERPDVLEALARLLGVSDFLWEDFLRLQHSNLFPVVKDLEGLAESKSREQLAAELDQDLSQAGDAAERCTALNAFKDREMFRIDMRHILGHITEFGKFSAELTDVAEVVVNAAAEICLDQLRARFGAPQLADGRPCPLAICALGKCGGRELGFASDIELMFVFRDQGQTTGPEAITNTEFFLRLVESFMHTIQAKREGIFRIDLRLRPYGRAGSLAVTLEAFEQYFGPEGAAWPYERQALVKLRPIGGDLEFGRELKTLRDRLIYTGEPFDVAAMRAMREKQGRQLVKAGTLNAKLSPGGLVDSEYLVQGLQITYGDRDPALRATNTRQAMAALEEHGILSAADHQRLQEAYIFQRRLIDALRMVRGDARDLTVPAPSSEEFEFLARRLGYAGDALRVQADLENYTQSVQELGRLLDAALPVHHPQRDGGSAADESSVNN